jgi:exodeoxyribonuclease VII small subunit
MKTKSFEEMLTHSKEILEKLMDQEITLEQSVKLYEEGLTTIKGAQSLIEEAKTKITIIEKNMQSNGE